MSRRAQQRLDDVVEAIAAIRRHLQRGNLDDDLVFDAVRVRLIEIGEAISALPDDLLSQDPSIPWSQIVGMRERLAHGYFDTSQQIVQATVDHDLTELEDAVKNLLRHVDGA